jgi:Tfp pilus assembly protein PilN
MELNLRPAGVAKAEKVAAQRPYLIVAGICVLAGLAGWWQYYANAADKTRVETEEVERKAAPLSNLQGRMTTAKNEIDRLQQFAAPLVRSVEERDYWAKVLQDLNDRLPKEYIWITKFSPPSREEVKKAADDAARDAAQPGAKKNAKEAPPIIVMADGIYLSASAGNAAGAVSTVDEFIAKLKDSPYVEPLADEAVGFTRAADNTPEWGYKFTLPLKLKNPIDLK